MMIGRLLSSRSTSAWACQVALAGLALVGRRDHFVKAALEVIESVVDRDNDGLHVEDILEGFGGTPVSVEFSPVSNHMFIGFRAGEVRIYPDGGDTTDAAVYDSCIDMEDNVYENNDLGLLNFRLHPDWPDTPYGYFLYTHDPGYEDDCLVEPYFCEKDHRFARVEVDYDEGTDTVTCGAQAILINDWCTGSNHHGGGGMAFMENGDMALTVGDLSKAEQRVIGDEEGNTCFRDDIGLPQGYFRSILDDFNEGKLLRISADALVAEAPDTADTIGFLERDTDFWHEAKGFRNPFRLVVAPGSGDVIIADVGLDTAESLKVVPNPLEADEGASMGNYGWPCMEGNAWIPPYLSLWLVESESDACDAIRGTTLGLPEEVDYDALVESALAGEVDWVPAAFTYRLDTIDSEYPDMCTTTLASVTALHIYQGSYLPDRYSNVLFVGDFAKNCVFYFDVDDATGTFDWTTPHVLFDSRSVVDFTTDPKTGILYAIDAKIAVLIKITVEDGITSAVSKGADVVLEADVTEGMVPLEVTLNASASSDADGIVAVQWDCEGDGVLEAEGDWSVEVSKTQVCTYDVDGTYEATVHLTNSLNATTSDSIEILAGDAIASTDAPTPAPTLAPTDAPVSTPAPVAAPVGNPLTSPPELEWEVDENGTRSGVLEFGVLEVDNFWGHTVTRGYNGQMPGPTMRMEACRTYELTLKNMLTLPNPGGEWNTMKDPNSTNIHTHGLHISGESPADDVLFVDVLPGEEHTYVYTLPCDHAGGTFWYHPHHHGSTALQMGGGAMGILIVEDRPDVHGIPDQYADMPEIIVTVQEMYPEAILFDQNAAGGTLFNTTATSRHYLVNGMVVPTIDLATGNWTRIRIAFAGQGDNHAISLQDPDGDCEMGVLAKDGVYLSEVPRMEPQLFFTPASRVDVAVRCLTAGDYDILMESTTSVGSDMRIAVLSVTGSSGGGIDANLTTWEPCRPYYLQDLIDLEIDNDSVRSVLVRETIGEEYFKGPDDYLFNLSEGSVHQWLLEGSEQHPFHTHVNHMQFYDVDGPGLVPGWNHVGDWVDTVSTGLAVVRFRTERYGGHVAMHCHVNSHGDTGVMAVVNVIGGEGPNEDPIALAAGTCGTEGVVGYGYSLDEMSSEDGATSSTIDSSSDAGELEASGNGGSGSDSDNGWWVAVAAGGGAGIGLLAIGLIVLLGCRGRTAVAKKPGAENGGEEKAETKSEKA